MDCAPLARAFLMMAEREGWTARRWRLPFAALRVRPQGRIVLACGSVRTAGFESILALRQK